MPGQALILILLLLAPLCAHAAPKIIISQKETMDSAELILGDTSRIGPAPTLVIADILQIVPQSTALFTADLGAHYANIRASLVKTTAYLAAIEPSSPLYFNHGNGGGDLEYHVARLAGSLYGNAALKASRLIFTSINSIGGGLTFPDRKEIARAYLAQEGITPESAAIIYDYSASGSALQQLELQFASEAIRAEYMEIQRLHDDTGFSLHIHVPVPSRIFGVRGPAHGNDSSGSPFYQSVLDTYPTSPYLHSNGMTDHDYMGLRDRLPIEAPVTWAYKTVDGEIIPVSPGGRPSEGAGVDPARYRTLLQDISAFMRTEESRVLFESHHAFWKGVIAAPAEAEALLKAAHVAPEDETAIRSALPHFFKYRDRKCAQMLQPKNPQQIRPVVWN